jgi:hypothetical protein
MKKNNLDLNGPVNEHYQKFFEKFKEIESLEVSKWNTNHLIGYFCKIYKNHYNCDYNFKFNSSAPSKSFEVFQMKKLAQNLTTSPVIIKKYIEWAFKEKVKAAKRRITSIAFLSHENLVSEYKLKYLAGELKDQQIDRTTLIPKEYLDIVQKYSYQIFNYGELSFLIQIDDKSISEMSKELEEAGMNLNLVRKIV